jgi:hypothetical protein
MGVFAKVIAVIVLIGSVVGVLMSLAGVIALIRLGALETVLADAATAASYFGQLGFGLFISICAVVLAILVLAARSPAPTRSA